jgi:hypothetical protein
MLSVSREELGQEYKRFGDELLRISVNGEFSPRMRLQQSWWKKLVCST